MLFNKNNFMTLKNENNNAFLVILAVVILLSIVVSFYRYIVKEDFVYFTTEEDIPDRFNLNSY